MVKTEQLRLMKEIESDLPLLFVNQDRLHQILINLLRNAVKFTEEGAITITARRDGWSGLAIAVSDTESAYQRRRASVFSRNFIRAIEARPGGIAAPDWDSRSAATSLDC
jgi:K+-sensing histidine kinase KdpD